MLLEGEATLPDAPLVLEKHTTTHWSSVLWKAGVGMDIVLVPSNSKLYGPATLLLAAAEVVTGIPPCARICSAV